MLAALELLATGLHEIQEFLFLGYFVPIAIAARYYSRAKALTITFITIGIYLLAFIPNMLTLEEQQRGAVCRDRRPDLDVPGHRPGP